MFPSGGRAQLNNKSRITIFMPSNFEFEDFEKLAKLV